MAKQYTVQHYDNKSFKLQLENEEEVKSFLSMINNTAEWNIKDNQTKQIYTGYYFLTK